MTTKHWTAIALEGAKNNPDIVINDDVVIVVTPPAATAWLAEHPAPLPAAQAVTLPLPPSTNDNWDNFNGRTVLSEAAASFRAGVRLIGNIEQLRPFDGPVAVYTHVYCANVLQDLDNYDGKALLDALQGVLFHNDRQVVERHSWRHDDKVNPRIEVEVRQVTP
jgi:crossover junction endodeoxyribonuclease RusA